MLDPAIYAILGLWAGAYAIGATPISYLLGRAFGGIDLRMHGSGNVGGSNLARQLGRRWMPLVIAVDLTRGAAPILVGQYVLELGAYPWLLAVTPLFTVLGNSWSPILKFTGGRSVGVWAGGVVGISPSLFLAALIAYLCGWFASKRSAETLLGVMCILPLVCLAWPDRWLLVGAPAQFAAYAAVGVAMIVVKRLEANGGALPSDASTGSVLLNRLLRDRDIADRQEWIARSPDRTADL